MLCVYTISRRTIHRVNVMPLIRPHDDLPFVYRLQNYTVACYKSSLFGIKAVAGISYSRHSFYGATLC